MDLGTFARLCGTSMAAFGLAGVLIACRSEMDGASRSSKAETTSCDGGASCPSARFVGTLSGDTGDGGLSTTGTTSTWLHLRVTEDNDDFNGRPVRLRARLVAPSTGTFELRAHFDDSRNDDAGLECARLVATSSPLDGGALLDLAWGDPPDATANGADDGRTVALEVRSVSGTCAAGASWRLDLRGNP